ncbi:MAG: HAD-IIA family hydrolase [Candidatus Nanohaloarchaea archaeon]|nr:HAD-IIA family hydrolase [Candidatus Nanohaloarchaea archaeon]
MAYERSLEDVENFVFDLDGTVWEWNRLKPGARKTITELQERGKEVYFLTNNSIMGRRGYAEKLEDMGIDTSPGRVIPVSYIAAETFDEMDVRRAYTIAEEGFRDELARRNIQHSEDADHVVVAVDRNFSYWKAAKAAELVRGGAELWCTSVDAFWWAGDRSLPGSYALAETVKQAADVDTMKVLGKPSEHARSVVKSEWKLMPGNTIVIGDNMKSDVVLGNRMGYRTGLVLGGSTDEEDLNDAGPHEKPNLVFREFERILMKV